MSKTYYIYILASEPHRTLYLGMTNDLERRVYEHKNQLIDGFTKQYNIKRLVYFEDTTDVHAALEREKQLKKWKRSWKIDLITRENPSWHDLSVRWTPGRSQG